MSNLADKFNVDLTDLQNLLEGVVAFVEVRVGNDDISNEIAREMKEIGAVISENKNNKVTHVIFRNGTLRTSNWAKKHDVPLVDIGWLATCTKNKANLLSRPWHVRYLEEPVDMFGSKKRKKYKKYFKNMNVTEFEAAMLKVKEKRNKKLEKSLNNSKSDNNHSSPEHRYRIDLSEPLRIPPKPDVVKRYEARLARYKETGRFSWELDEPSIDDSPLDENINVGQSISENPLTEIGKNVENLSDKILTNDYSIADENKSLDAVDEVKENIDIDFLSKTIDSDKFGSSGTKSTRKIAKSRRLFSQLNISNDILNLSNDNLIVPVSKLSEIEQSKSILPEAVQLGISCNSKNSRKRNSSSSVKCKPIKRSSSVLNDELDICLPNKKMSKVQNPKPSSSKMSTPVKNNAKSNLSVSPLVTNKSTSMDIFKTPKRSKRKSLRTRLLKQSAKKKYNQTGYYEDPVSSSDEDQSEVFEPETVKIDHRKETERLGNCSRILETPEYLNQTTGNVFQESKCGFLKNSEINDSLMTPESGKKCNDSKYSLYSSGFFTPNASRCLDKLIPNRSKPDSYDHILFIPKDDYDHCSKAILPDFVDQIKYVKSNVSVPFTDDIKNKIIPNKNKRKSSKIIRVCPRRSARLSSTHSQDIIDLTFVDPVKASDSIENSNPINIDIDCDKSTNTPESIFTAETKSTDNQRFPSINTGPLLKVELDPLDIFKFEAGSDSCTRKYCFRKPSGNELESIGKPETESTVKVNRKRPWSQVLKTNAKTRVAKKKYQEITKTPRDSLDDFELNPLKQKKTKIQLQTGHNELVMAGFSTESQKQIKSIVNKLPHLYKLFDFITSKSQLIILPEKPKRCIQLVRALVYGNILVSESWIHQSSQSKKWLNYSAFIVKEIDLIDVPFSNVDIVTSLFNDYSSMYISSTANGMQKYKLRIIIESAGGKVSESFRQAGIVINTHKINALSVNEFWILDSIKEGKVLDPKQYLIL